MAVLPTDWKMGKCLEWYTQLPLINRHQNSPVFIIQNVECYFSFSGPSGGYYYLWVTTKETNAQLKSFSFTIYANYDGASTDKLTQYKKKATFSSSDTSVFCFSNQPFVNKVANLSIGFPIKYFFVFEHNVGLILPSEIKIDEKSTQADLMLSLQTDVEYLSLDFSELLKSGKHSDVQLLCNGGNIPAHKAILAARSKAFSDMLQDSTEESKSGLINLTTTEISVMEFCLEYIYKGKILNLPVDKASNLYVLGHVFKISSLTKMCADLMVSNLSEDNYIPYLVLADKYDDEHFKCGIIEYLFNHVELLKSESWLKFSDKYMKTANEVYRKCMFK